MTIHDTTGSKPNDNDNAYDALNKYGIDLGMFRSMWCGVVWCGVMRCHLSVCLPGTVSRSLARPLDPYPYLVSFTDPIPLCPLIPLYTTTPLLHRLPSGPGRVGPAGSGAGARGRSLSVDGSTCVIFRCFPDASSDASTYATLYRTRSCEWSRYSHVAPRTTPSSLGSQEWERRPSWKVWRSGLYAVTYRRI